MAIALSIWRHFHMIIIIYVIRKLNSPYTAHSTQTHVLWMANICVGEENNKFAVKFFSGFSLLSSWFDYNSKRKMYNVQVHVECISESHLKSVQAHQCNNNTTTACNNNNNWSRCFCYCLRFEYEHEHEYYMCTISRLLSIKCRMCVCVYACAWALRSLNTCNCLLFIYI